MPLTSAVRPANSSFSAPPLGSRRITETPSPLTAISSSTASSPPLGAPVADERRVGRVSALERVLEFRDAGRQTDPQRGGGEPQGDAIHMGLPSLARRRARLYRLRAPELGPSSSKRTGVTRKQCRFAFLALGLTVLAAATALVLMALRDTIVVFYGPKDAISRLASGDRKPGQRIRLGSLWRPAR